MAAVSFQPGSEKRSAPVLARAGTGGEQFAQIPCHDDVMRLVDVHE